MADRIEQISEDVYNLRGSFKIGGLIDVGTHASLVRRADGRFLMLDAYVPSGPARAELMQLTEDGRKVEAVLNLHPFHTIHCKALHEWFPDAEVYGTDRHVQKVPELPWQPQRTDDPELHERFTDDLEFSVPAGVDFISANEQIHFSSVLARHRRSRTLHVDDTLSYGELPSFVRLFGWNDLFAFHPTLASALKPEPGAAAAFRAWAQDLATAWADTEVVCTAHIGIWRAGDGPGFSERVMAALERVERTLAAHARKHG